MNLCSACRRDFASVAAFDKHRTGVHAYDFSLERPDGRRCMSEEEMLEAGMELDRKGRWSIPKTAAQLAFYEQYKSPEKSRQVA